MLVRREVESIVEAIDCVGHDESPRHSAVLRLADVLTKSVFSSRRRSPNTSSQGFMEVSFTCISQRTPSNLLKMALMKPSSRNRLYHFTCPSSALRLWALLYRYRRECDSVKSKTKLYKDHLPSQYTVQFHNSQRESTQHRPFHFILCS